VRNVLLLGSRSLGPRLARYDRGQMSLTTLKQTGRVDRFHGRLGNLAIPDKYDVAVSIASGVPHNMVVDTVAQSQK